MEYRWIAKIWIALIVLLWVSLECSSVTLGPQTVNASEHGVKDAAYWTDRGNLFSVYGNYKAAVRCYKQVLELEPKNSYARFNLGISYGELGDYNRAIEAIDRSIRLNPKNSTFFYGRGRVFLLSGDKEEAMKDFLTAAELGSLDAKNYLEYVKEVIAP